MNEIDLNDILTFDELLEDEYYKSEFEKRLQQEFDIKNSHSDVKGGKTMDNIQQPNEGEFKDNGIAPALGATPPTQPAPPKPEATPTDNPAVTHTEAKQPKEETPADLEPAKEMTAEQFELYNETLRRVSKTAKTDLQNRYNAFEDAEVKALIKTQILAGEKPNIKNVAAGVVIRLAPKVEPTTEPKPHTTENTKDAEELAGLKAELALVKAGIVPERLEAAKKLFLAEGSEPEKAAEFVSKYPEWKVGANMGIAFSKAPPISGRTAPNPSSPPVLNDFEKRVADARKKAGLN